jgi:hypothetical protein
MKLSFSLLLFAIFLLVLVSMNTQEVDGAKDSSYKSSSKKICGEKLCSQVKSCPAGQTLDPILKKCFSGSGGWKITGYFLPLEKDYPKDSLVSVYVSGKKRNSSYDYMENNSTYYLKQFRDTFLKEIVIQGSGKTNDGKILQSWTNDFINPDGVKTRFYHYGKCAFSFSGVCLTLSQRSLNDPIVMVAVTHGPTDMKAGVIAHGTLLRIPDIPSPWNARTYWAVDIGEWRDKHIDIFTGYGLEARANAYKITKLPPTESSRVLAVGFKEIKP